MKKVVQINYQNAVFTIEEAAYELLKKYIESLKIYFKKEESADEIMHDIELRIAELMSDAIKKGALCITEEIITTITSSIGNPNDLAEEAAASFEEEQKTVNQDAATEGEQPIKNWTRASNQSMLGGVCAGIAHRYQIDVTIVRLFFVLFLFTGIGFLLYLLLWIILPSEPIPSFTKKRLFRSPDNKRIGGVCAGLGFYFNIDAWIFRILFLAPFIISFFHWHSLFFWYEGGIRGTSVLIYIIMLIIIPKAKTAADKLEMKGQKVDLDAIKEVVNKDLKNLDANAHKMSEQIKASFKSGKHSETINEIKDAVNPIFKLVKIVIAFVVFCFAFFFVLLTIALITRGLNSHSVVAYILDFNTNEKYLYYALSLLLLLPMLGVLLAAINLMTNHKLSLKWVSRSFLFIWIVALVAFIVLGANYVSNFEYKATLKKDIPVVPFKSSTIHVFANNDEEHSLGDNQFQDNYKILNLISVSEQAQLNSNIKIDAYPSMDSSFRVQLLYCSKGASQEMAKQYVAALNLNVLQRDSVLLIDPYLTVPDQQQFRNQNCIVRIYIPIGKRIVFHENLEHYQWYSFDANTFNVRWHNANNGNHNQDLYNWEETYQMGYDGLELVD
jgi:phage shock protein PspC (stress-responsive transcriptional regulator)